MSAPTQPLPSPPLLGRDLTALAAAGRLGGAVAREDSLATLLEILGRWRRNVPVLVGPAGSGRGALFEQLALEIVAGRTKAPFRRVLEMPLPDLLRESTPAERLAWALEEARADHALLVLADAHTVIGAGGDFPMTASVLRRALARNEPRLALSTTPEGWDRHLASESGRLVPLVLPGLGRAGAAALLARAAEAVEAHYGLRIAHPALDALAAHVVATDAAQPSAILDTFDDVAARAAAEGLSSLDAEDAARLAVAGRAGIAPVPSGTGIRDLTALAAAGKLRPTLGRDRELRELVAALSRRAGTVPVLVGERGAGRTALVEHLALEVQAGRVPRLRGGTVLEVCVASLMGQEHPQQKLHDLLVRTRARGNTLLVLRDPVALLQAESSLPLTTQELRAALEAGDPPIALLSTPGDHRRWLAGMPVLGERGALVTLEAPPPSTMEAVLQRARPEVSSFYGVDVAEDACVAVRQSAEADRAATLAEPGRSLRLLDEICARAAERGMTAVSAADVPILAAASLAETLPVLGQDARVADLEAELAAALVGQDRAIRTVTRRLRLTRLELDASPDRPDGVFLFAGPSGVGKTLLARTLARALYAGDDAFLHLDMSEYSEPHAVARLAGAPPGYVGHEAEPRLVQRIRNRPRSLVLFDEIEKAHPQVLLLLLQILDTGRFTDSRGFTADFRKATIVMTSNLGRELYGDRFLGRRTPGFGDAAAAPVLASPGVDAYRQALLRSLPAEFVGRIHDIVVFEALTREALLRIARRRLDELRARIGGHGREVVVQEGVAEAVVDRGLDPALGARQLVSAIDQVVTAPLVDLMFTPAWHEHGRVVVKAANGEVVVEILPG